MIADDHILDIPFAVDDGTNLAVDFEGEFGEGSRKVRADDAICGYAAAIEIFKPFYLACLKSIDITVELRSLFPLRKIID